MPLDLSTVESIALIASFVVAALLCFIMIPRLIRSFTARGMVGKDFNKFEAPEIAEMGGVAVVSSFFVGAILVMGISSLALHRLIPDVTLFLAALIAVLGAAFVGAIDDLFDLRQRVKAFLPVLFGIPLGIVVSDQTIHLPGVELNLGLWMIPILAVMVSAGANAANMLEGFNGLGAGLGLIGGSTLAVLSFARGSIEGLVILVPYLGATAALLYYNRYPARVFPGDTFTLFSGAVLVCAAVVSDLKEVGAILFLPMIVEFVLKARHQFGAESYGIPRSDGTLDAGAKMGSLTHIAIRRGLNTERRVVAAFWSLEGALAVAVSLVVLV